MVEKLSGPNAMSATVGRTMSAPDDDKKPPLPTQRPQDWTAEEKWALVLKAAAVPQAEPPAV